MTEDQAATEGEAPPTAAQADAQKPKEASEPKKKPSSEEDSTAPAAEDSTAQAEPAPEKPAKPKRKAKKVTAKVLRAAARTTADIKDIVAAEARSRSKQDNEQSSVFALAQEMHESGQGKVEAPEAAGPGPGTTTSASEPTPPETRAPGAPRPARATSTAAPQARPSPTPRPAPSPRPAPGPPRQPAPPSAAPTPIASTGPLLALAVSVFVAGAMVAWSLHGQSEALRALAERQAEAPQIRLVPTEIPASPGSNQSTGALAEVGAGRVVYADSSGRLVVLRRDPTSAELEVERVYALVHDEGRGQGQPDRRYHSYYLDDLEGQRKSGIEAALKRYEAAVAHAARTYTDVDKADAAAVALVAAGGADRLTQYLGPEITALRRRTAVVGLAEGGYLCAVEPLLGLLQDHVRNPKFFARLVGLAGRLISQELDPSDPEAVLAAVRTWLAKDTHRDPFARVKGP